MKLVSKIQQNALFDSMVLLVMAIKQTTSSHGKGKEKRAKVLERFDNLLNEYGIEMPQEDISELLEKAVYYMNKSKEET